MSLLILFIFLGLIGMIVFRIVFSLVRLIIIGCLIFWLFRISCGMYLKAVNIIAMKK